MAICCLGPRKVQIVTVSVKLKLDTSITQTGFSGAKFGSIRQLHGYGKRLILFKSYNFRFFAASKMFSKLKSVSNNTSLFFLL